MVVVNLPDQVAVMSYVHSLRVALIGVERQSKGGTPVDDKQRHSILALSDKDAKVRGFSDSFIEVLVDLLIVN